MVSVTSRSGSVELPTQNWVISPVGDFLLIVAAPALALLWALSVVTTLGAFWVLAIFAIFNTAHHLPTFIRIYGDKDLIKRFRWSLILGPVIPFTIAVSLVAFLISRGLSIQHALCLWVILVIWDPWHFIMQHYGFMRIYDRHNRAPPRLASRMDQMIAFSWFIFIMASVADWLPELLYSLTTQNAIPVLYYFDENVFAWLRTASLSVALVATLVYAGYVIWCMRRGYFVSWAKLAMVAVTFGIMYLTYVPNSAMDSIIAGMRQFRSDIPDWSFRLGFSTVGMVHVTQYLAIVWKYNRGLVRRSGGRDGAFTKLFLRGGLLIACIYVAACLAYGFALSDQAHPLLVDPDRPISEAPRFVQGLIGVLMATLFTSTILHYYFDGFIWKVRHKENRQNLDLQEPSGEQPTQSASWWDSDAKLTVARTLGWQAVYFALPMLFLAVTYCLFMSSPRATPLKSLSRALAIPVDQRDTQAKIQAVEALAAAEQRLAIEQRMTQLRPLGEHFTYSYELIAKMAEVRRAYLPEQFTAYDSQQSALAAIEALENALAHGEPFRHLESEREITQQDVEQWLAAVQRQLPSTEQPADSGG